jgi:hypothetical protein
MVISSSGAMIPMTEGSTKAATVVMRHPGIMPVRKFRFLAPF